jgi:hypothetical protein
MEAILLVHQQLLKGALLQVTIDSTRRSDPAAYTYSVRCFYVMTDGKVGSILFNKEFARAAKLKTNCRGSIKGNEFGTCRYFLAREELNRTFVKLGLAEITKFNY